MTKLVVRAAVSFFALVTMTTLASNQFLGT